MLPLTAMRSRHIATEMIYILPSYDKHTNAPELII